jgi:hypothetical protein
LWNVIALAVAFPTATASVSVLFMRASGANGCRWRMPMLAARPRSSGSMNPSWDDQILPALARIGPRPAHVDHEAEEGVVDGTRPAAGRISTTGGAVGFEVEEHRARDRVRAAGQQQRAGIKQLIKDHDLMTVGCSALDIAAAQRFHRRGGDEVKKHFHAPEEVQVVVGRCGRSRPSARHRRTSECRGGSAPGPAS